MCSKRDVYLGKWSATIAVKKVQTQCTNLAYQVSPIEDRIRKQPFKFIEFCKPGTQVELMGIPKQPFSGQRTLFAFGVDLTANAVTSKHHIEIYRLWKRDGNVVAAAVVQTIFGDAVLTGNPIQHMYTKTLWVRVDAGTGITEDEKTELVRQIQTSGPPFPS